MKEKHYLDEVIDGLIEMFGEKSDSHNYVTLILGVLVGTEKDVTETEKEFDIKTNDLLSANAFIKLSNFKRKEK